MDKISRNRLSWADTRMIGPYANGSVEALFQLVLKPTKNGKKKGQRNAHFKGTSKKIP